MSLRNCQWWMTVTPPSPLFSLAEFSIFIYFILILPTQTNPISSTELAKILASRGCD